MAREVRMRPRAYRSRKGGIPRVAHRDLHEPEIIRAFREAGAKVTPLSIKKVPDLLVGFLGVNHLVEVKTDNETLNPEQAEWHREWTGEKPLIARNEAHARKLVRMWLAEFAERERKAG